MGVQRHDALVGGASGAAAAAPQPVKQLSAGASRAGAGELTWRGMTIFTGSLMHIADSGAMSGTCGSLWPPLCHVAWMPTLTDVAHSSLKGSASRRLHVLAGRSCCACMSSACPAIKEGQTSSAAQCRCAPHGRQHTVLGAQVAAAPHSLPQQLRGRPARVRDSAALLRVASSSLRLRQQWKGRERQAVVPPARLLASGTW